jgi:GTPase
LRAGHGGKGSTSFRHEPFVPRGGPDGGDGGRGGSILLRATTEMTDLSEYARRSRWQAPAGGDGAGGRKTGKRGADLVLDVPVGTMVLDEGGALIVDLDRAGAKQVIAAGGEGGRGNVHFKSATRRAPDHAEPGLPGEERAAVLDLKLIADVGLVGPPNAGKSSLLRALTAATPKVAAYPFTTLDPELGVMEAGKRRLVLADIPGLVEGASRGVGLGLRFLRHVERTRVLAYVVDGSAPDPWADLEAVRTEVGGFSSGLGARPYLVVVNKLDLEDARRFRARSRRRGAAFVSALTGEGLPELGLVLVDAVERAPAPSLPARAAIRLPARGAASGRPAVERHPWGFAVRGERVERLVERTNFDSDGGLQRFQVELDRLGVNEALEAAGAQPGDTVRIGSAEFEYQP